MFTAAQRQYLERARLGRLATADDDGRPHVVPVCFALVEDRIVTPIDEKPQRVGPADLRRVRDIEANPRVALVVDHYAEDWVDLGWVQMRGTAGLVAPDEKGHADSVAALRAKYDQYADHDLEVRPLLVVDVGSVSEWGTLQAD